ncbi:MAG TPA: galactokinase family protein [Chloroflexota bacterium]|nr:galactokinase family protein [Chloroflexota bacterium]
MDGEARALPWQWFQPDRPVYVARAPGRLDVMGGIADYSGALVLQMSLALGATVGVQHTNDGLLRARTTGPFGATLARQEVAVPVSTLVGAPYQAPERLRAALTAGHGAWAAYPLGPLAMLVAAGLLTVSGDEPPGDPRGSSPDTGATRPAPAIGGVRLAVWSDVPPGAGISSSAALEIAALRAFATLYDIELDPLRLATLAQQAEHRVALAPCGIMDQVASLLGHRDHLLLLKCQPAQVLGHRHVPRDVWIRGIDSGVTHRVAGAQYGRVRAAAFMGRAIIAAHAPDEPAGGYLCNVPAARFDERYTSLLPEALRGADFLARYGETGDDATRVEPDVVYRVRDCTAHPILEQENVDEFLAALDHYDATGRRHALAEAGAAMFRSHESYGMRCGLGTVETDMIVDLVRRHGQEAGLFGARITGGGGGGTVAILGAGPQALAAVEEIAAEYSRATGNPARVIAGGGPGALDMPVITRDAGAA